MKEINRNGNSSFIGLRRWTSPITDIVSGGVLPYKTKQKKERQTTAAANKNEILELPRRQNASKMFSVVAITRNSSTTHRNRRTTREK